MLSLGYLQYAPEFLLQLLDQEGSTVLAPGLHCQQRGQGDTRGHKEICFLKGKISKTSLSTPATGREGEWRGENPFCTKEESRKLISPALDTN